jgi:luciferase family oxidoreductase group 1
MAAVGAGERGRTARAGDEDAARKAPRASGPDHRRLRLSILDLAPVAQGQSANEAFAASVMLAQLAETLGYERVWYAEHHNIPAIASSATSVVIAHVGAHTQTIRLGAGGIMLPNHSPLVIAEQFGTLEAMYPGRIDLGLGRAPGSDRETMRALRRGDHASDTFPQDVLELQGYLIGKSVIAGVEAIPGAGSNVPLYLLGSSLYGAQLAAALGLPYAFASHFAPAALEAALAAYRDGFQPSGRLERPYVIVGVTVLAADTDDAARAQLQAVRRLRAVNLFGRQLGLSDPAIADDRADEILAAGAAARVDEMLTYAAVGTPDDVRGYLEGFARMTGADELMTVHPAPSIDERLLSIRLLAAVMRSRQAG